MLCTYNEALNSLQKVLTVYNIQLLLNIITSFGHFIYSLLVAGKYKIKIEMNDQVN